MNAGDTGAGGTHWIVEGKVGVGQTRREVID